MTISISFRGKTHTVDTPLSSPLSALTERLEALTGVPQSNQKLVWKGRKTTSGDSTLEEAGLAQGTKIMLMGTTANELDALKSTEAEVQRRDAIMARRAATGASKIRSTGSSSTSQQQFRFHRIEPLPHLPKPEEALNILTKLANDPAVKHVMALHKFSVGVLTELAPHEHPNLLGLNVNGGEAIKLRIRTDSYDGFRLYSEIRRVSLHELTHNVWGPHDDKFKTLNSELNREVAQFEAAAREGAHLLNGGGSMYEPSAAAHSHSHVLGGGMTGGTNVLGGGSSPVSLEERRARAVQAAMKRFKEQEQELEDRCAT